MREKAVRRGDQVYFALGTRSVKGKVKEDRGPIGVKGRHLFLVEFHLESDPQTASYIELPADDLHAQEFVPLN